MNEMTEDHKICARNCADFAEKCAQLESNIKKLEKKLNVEKQLNQLLCDGQGELDLQLQKYKSFADGVIEYVELLPFGALKEQLKQLIGGLKI